MEQRPDGCQAGVPCERPLVLTVHVNAHHLHIAVPVPARAAVVLLERAPWRGMALFSVVMALWE